MPVLFLLSIGGTPAPTLFAFPLVALLILVRGIGSMGSVRIMTTRLISQVRAHRGIIIILRVVFWVLWVGLLSIVLEFQRLSCQVVVIRRGCPFRENGQSGCWTRDLLWFPSHVAGQDIYLLGGSCLCPLLDSRYIPYAFWPSNPNPATSPRPWPTTLR